MAASVAMMPMTARMRQNRRQNTSDMVDACRETCHSSLLRVAAATWNREQPTELRALLQNGSRAQETDVQNNTCLHLLLANAHPNQHWTVLSLTDPRRLNHFGCTAFDIACNAQAVLGSFRRDLLLQALLETELEILDERLLAPTHLTDVYNELRHETLFVSPSNTAEFELQVTLHEQLTAAVEKRNLNCNRDLLKPVLQRVHSRFEEIGDMDPTAIIRTSLEYLERMCEGKKQIVRICTSRINKDMAIRLGGSLNLLQMRERANVEALLEFDWFRPVDVDDLFSSYVDIMMEKLDALRPANGNAEHIDRLIEMMQHTISSYEAPLERDIPSVAADEVERADSGRCLKPLTTEFDQARGNPDWLQNDGSALVDVERKASIVQTPVRFYGAEF